MTTLSPRDTRLFQLIDDAHRVDPNLEHDTKTNQKLPKELLYASRMTDMLDRFAPDASIAVRISVRAQHIQRWMIPRNDFPKTPLGYKQWRTRLYKYHADVTGDLMCQAGYEDEMIVRVKSIVGKLGIKVNPETQLLEDIASLVFLEHYLSDFAAGHPEYDNEKWLAILRKTWLKMSANGQAFALSKIHLPDSLVPLIIKASNA